MLRRPSIDARPLIARATDGAAQRLATVVVGLPDELVDAVMQTPLRRPIIDTIFRLMPRHLDHTRAAGLDACIRWRVTSLNEPAEAEVFDLEIKQRRFRVTRGAGERRPAVTITITAAEMVRLAAGKSTPMQAYFAGRLALRGDIMQAARLASLFRAPSTPRRNTSRQPGSTR